MPRNRTARAANATHAVCAAGVTPSRIGRRLGARRRSIVLLCVRLFRRPLASPLPPALPPSRRPLPTGPGHTSPLLGISPHSCVCVRIRRGACVPPHSALWRSRRGHRAPPPLSSLSQRLEWSSLLRCRVLTVERGGAAVLPTSVFLRCVARGSGCPADAALDLIASGVRSAPS